MEWELFLLLAIARHQTRGLNEDSSKLQRKGIQKTHGPAPCTVTLNPCKSPSCCISCSPNHQGLRGDSKKMPDFCATSPVAAFQSFYFMISCSSFSFGEMRSLPPQLERGNGCLFSNSPALGFAVATAAAAANVAAAVRPLACCLAAERRASQEPTASVKWDQR